MGPHGQGQLTKAVNNCLYDISCAAMAEILPFATKAGMDVQALTEVVTKGCGQSFGFDKFAPLVPRRAFAAPAHGYPMGAAYKDLQNLAAEARACGVSLPVFEAAKGTYEAALDRGLQHECKGAMVKVFEERMGVTVKSAMAPTSPLAYDVQRCLQYDPVRKPRKNHLFEELDETKDA